MNTLRYLRRIGVAQLQPETIDGLAYLQEHHLLHVPFENLDIKRTVPISLDTGTIYDKVIGDRRGGFCYELNGLFCELLRELGYTVDMVSARVFRDNGTLSAEFDHMALIVHLAKQRLLVDVGFGDSARGPLPLPNGQHADISGHYRLKAAESSDTEAFVLERETDGAWKGLFQFSTVAREPNEFSDMCRYHQTSPDSHFTQRNMITIATPTGRFTLTDTKVTETESGLKMETPVGSVEEYERILEEKFGIRF
ncbi:arylamine N-acetyltransferase [bacterium]|nr:arylamine N-acetyltransferase [bacterium]